MEHFRYKFERFLRNFVWLVDYLVWLVISPYKFKRLPKKVESIIVVENIALGDLIVTTPVYKALKYKYPNSKLDVFVNPNMKDVLKENPHIDNIITEIKGDYDLGIILHARFENYKLSKLLKKHAKFRIGCTRVGVREGKGFFLHRKTKPNFKLKHKVYDNLDVLKSLEIRNFNPSLEIYTDFKPDLKSYVVLHMCPAHKTHYWSKEKFARLAGKLSEKYNIVFTGIEKDLDYINEVRKMMESDSKIVIGSILEFFGWIKHAKFVVSVDTSAMHVAAGFDTPVVALFGAGVPNIWRPFSKNGKVVFKGNYKCTNCLKHSCKYGDFGCMESIKVEDVLNLLEHQKLFK